MHETADSGNTMSREHVVVAQAENILAARDEIPLEEARRLLRDDAEHFGRPVREIAVDIVNVAKAAAHDPYQNLGRLSLFDAAPE